jgi:uncharacterized membrane protein
VSERTDVEEQPLATSRGDAETEGTLGYERIVFFSDAVFAIVITLLVLPLTELHLPEGGGNVAGQVWALRSVILTFAVTFLVVGQFWSAHHGIFGLIRRFDPGLVWLNLLSLLTVAFMPFPAALLGRRADADTFPVVFYAAALTVASALLTTIWLYALHRGLTAPDLPPQRTRGVSRRGVATTCVFATSIGVAFLGLIPAAVMWLVVLPAARMLVSRGSNADR